MTAELFEADDGLLACEVGAWAKTKHDYLRRYVDISRGVRHKWLDEGGKGATYIDLFCGPGRGRIKGTGEFVDGSAIVAWNKSVEAKTPFSKVYVADIDERCVDACCERLIRLGAPVESCVGDALTSVRTLVPKLDPYALHFALLDPWNLGALNFEIIRALSTFTRIDILIHLSQMDLQRNFVAYSAADATVFDAFVPGWRSRIPQGSAKSGRPAILRLWADLVAELGVWPSTDAKLVTGDGNQPLYWLTLAAKHDLAHAFWKIASNKEGQLNLFDSLG